MSIEVNQDTIGLTRDTFYKGKVVVFQERKGYRFSLDAPILADFLPFLPGQRALEIGTGCGIISLLALHRKKFAHIYGIEIQENLSRLARLNACENGFPEKYQVIHADVNTIDIASSYEGIEHIFSNPPYRLTGQGRLSPSEEIRDAKFETKLTLKQLISRTFTTSPLNLYLILPFSRYDECMLIAQETGFYVSRRRYIFSFKDGKPERFLIQLTNRKVSPADLEPLVIFAEAGKYTEEMENIFAGR